jgi:hypothetical protein
LYRPAIPISPAHKPKRVIIAEGERDAILLSHVFHTDGPSNVMVYGLPSGVNLWRDSWLDEFSSSTQIILAFDSDMPGLTAAQGLLDKHRDDARIWGRHPYDPEWKATVKDWVDLAELYCANPPTMPYVKNRELAYAEIRKQLEIK